MGTVKKIFSVFMLVFFVTALTVGSASAGYDDDDDCKDKDKCNNGNHYGWCKDKDKCNNGNHYGWDKDKCDDGKCDDKR